MPCSFTLCFVLAGGVRFQKVWDEWRRNYSFVDILIHSSAPTEVPAAWRENVIPESIKTTLFTPSITQAMLLILKYGVLSHPEPDHKFFFVSDSTLPCQTPTTFRHILCSKSTSLMTHDRFWEFHRKDTAVQPYVPHYPVQHPARFKQFYAQRPHLVKPVVVKTGQWVAITGADVKLLQSEFKHRQRIHNSYILNDSNFWATTLLSCNVSLHYAALTYQHWRPAPQNHPLWLSQSEDLDRCVRYGYLTSRKWMRLPEKFFITM